MKSIIVAVLLALVAVGSGCLGKSTTDGAAVEATGDACPICKTKYSPKTFDQKGKPVTWKTWHVCPECKTDVASVSKGGQTLHQCLSHNEKTDSCPSCKSH